jgi:hypothetical protein
MVAEDVKLLSDEELLTEYYDAIQAIPGIVDAAVPDGVRGMPCSDTTTS